VSHTAFGLFVGRLLARLRGRGATRGDFVQQKSESDCGPAALASALLSLGHAVSLDAVASLCEVTPAGVSADELIRAAKHLGVSAVGVALNADALELLSTPAILHWNSNHFVVLYGVGVSGLELVDPALGHRSVSLGEARRAFSGVAIIFQ
jgi:ABC-type bacteriocin/lantibiotic exporter with double-glycine peptidase domain